jgi:hypothetical protein
MKTTEGSRLEDLDGGGLVRGKLLRAATARGS